MIDGSRPGLKLDGLVTQKWNARCRIWPPKAFFCRVQQAARPFDLRQVARVLSRQLAEHGTTWHEISKSAHELRRVPLADPEKIDNLTVEVIEHLNTARFLVKKHLRAATERLDVRGVWRKQRNEGRCEATLPANICQRSDHGDGMPRASFVSTKSAAATASAT